MTMRDPRQIEMQSRAAQRREVEEAVDAASPDQLRRLLADIRAVTPWWEREPMGRA